ncbi:MAG TPA: hypothetical protein VN310_18935 [Candidatus Dormibacteraeota bacterium]|nr:hypothetical protein [Candidatus Dormibacteraeota bacterium]
MAGSCWRLLAVCSLIFVAPSLLRGQYDSADRAADRSSADGLAGARAVASVLAPNVPPLRYPSPITPVWIPPPTPGPGPRVFQHLVRTAGIIFSGRVTSVGRATTSLGPDHASTAITFLVEHAMRGTSPNQTLTIHEWAGLWNRGERYHVGERLLLFLYTPSKLGLTSPVAGALGRFGLDSQGQNVMDPQQVGILASDPILGRNTVVPYTDFALAVRHFSREE